MLDGAVFSCNSNNLIMPKKGRIVCNAVGGVNHDFILILGLKLGGEF